MDKILTLCLLLVVSFNHAYSKNYKINDDAVENLISQSVEVSHFDISETLKGKALQGDKNQYVAGGIAAGAYLIGAGMFVIGPFFIFLPWVFTYVFWAVPAHRIYMGTNAGAIIAYLVSCGGCGLILLVDSIVLFAARNPSKYVNNNKVFMW